MSIHVHYIERTCDNSAYDNNNSAYTIIYNNSNIILLTYGSSSKQHSDLFTLRRLEYTG